MYKNKIFIFLLLNGFIIYGGNTDLIIFSYNRPLQLYAFLESLNRYIAGLNNIFVIYRSSTDEFEKAYQKVQAVFDSPIYLLQKSVDEFKKLTVQALDGSEAPYILFGVDDIIVKDYVDLDHCIALLNSHQAYGFYLRMGTHLTHAYPESNKQPLPPLCEIEPKIFSWQFAQGIHDWGYPNTVDMTLYRKKEVVPLIASFSFDTPNHLEGLWAEKSNMVKTRRGLCFKDTKIVNIPLNRVQNNFENPHMNFMEPIELLRIFNEGKKMDIMLLHQVKNTGSHWDYKPIFIERVS